MYYSSFVILEHEERSRSSLNKTLNATLSKALEAVYVCESEMLC